MSSTTPVHISAALMKAGQAAGRPVFQLERPRRTYQLGPPTSAGAQRGRRPATPGRLNSWVAR